MKKNLKQTIDQISKALLNHISAGDSAHLPATTSNAGFLSAEDKQRYDSAVGNRSFIESNVDIFTLEPGRYDGYSLINTPLSSSDTSMVSVDISRGINYDESGKAMIRKQITVIRSHDCKTWTTSIHQSGVVTGWTENLKMKKIWSGNATGGTLALSDPLSKFVHLLVEFEGKSVGIKKEIVNSGTFFSLQPLNLSNNAGSAILEFQEMQLMPDGQNLTIIHNRLLTVNLLSNPINTTIREDGEIKIYNIWGLPK